MSQSPPVVVTRKKSRRGFASMDKEKHRLIASKGGVAAHVKGTAHEFDSEEAAAAAAIGHMRGTAHEFTAEEARIAGKKGGIALAAKRAAARASLTPPPPPSPPPAPASDSAPPPPSRCPVCHSPLSPQRPVCLNCTEADAVATLENEGGPAVDGETVGG